MTDQQNMTDELPVAILAQSANPTQWWVVDHRGGVWLCPAQADGWAKRRKAERLPIDACKLEPAHAARALVSISAPDIPEGKMEWMP